MKKNLSLFGIAMIIVISFFLGYHLGIGNQSSKYGTTGLPQNCRALITDNLTGIANKKYTIEEALDSISRNCGPNGYIWNER